jgi:ABC-type nitrate/sulfonate/bicarbonate transport system permease component
VSSVSSSPNVIHGGGLAGRPRSFQRRVTDSPWVYRLISVAIVGVAWEIGATAAHSIAIPTFSSTLGAVVELGVDPELYEAFWTSNQALVFGFFLSVVVGIPLGFAAARFRGIEPYIDPYLNILLVVPMAALIPILISSLGIQNIASRIVLIFLFAVPIIIVNARTGVRQVDPTLIEMATSYGASEREIWRRVLLPGSIPAIMAGIRLGLGRAVTAMVIVELLMVAAGIGGLILEFRGFFKSAELYAVVIFIVVEALILISLARALERRIAPWARGTALRD